MSTLSSTRHHILLAALAFSVVLIVGYGADLFLPRRPGWMIVDDLILGVVAAIVVFSYERERGRILSERLRVIRDMNAFVRNELQILYASVEHPEKTRVTTIEGSVERIDWALRELLPGGQPRDGAPVEEIDGRTRNTERSA